MSYYPETGCHIRDKVKVLLDLSNYATKKELEHGSGVDTSNLAAKSDFIALKADIDKLGINELVMVPTSLNNLKTKIDDLHVDKLKTVPVDSKKISDAVNKEVVNMKVNNLGSKIPYAFNLIQTSQYNTDKQNLEKNIGDVENEIPDVSVLVTYCSQYKTWRS